MSNNDDKIEIIEDVLDSKYERETTLNTSDGEKKWTLDSFQRKIQTKLKNAGIEPEFIDEKSGRHHYILDFNQVSFRRKSTGSTKVMSEEHKLKLKNGREAKKKV